MKSLKKLSWLCCASGRIKTTTENAQKRKDWKGILPGFLISAVCLAIILYLIDPRKMVDALRMADYRFVLVALVLMIVWLAVRAFVWRTLLQEKASFYQVFFTLNEGYLLNNLLPFRLGEIGRAFLLGRKAQLDFWQVISTILIERALDVAMAVSLFLLTLPFVAGVTWALQAALVSGGAVLVGLVLLYALARNRTWVEIRIASLGVRWPAINRLGAQRIPAFLDGLSVLSNGRRFILAVTRMVLNWALGILEAYVLMKAFFPQASLLWPTFSLGVFGLGIAAPSTPGSVGVFELVLMWALSLFVDDPSKTAAFALTYHFMNYLVTGLLGGYALAQDGESLSGLYRKAKSIG